MMARRFVLAVLAALSLSWLVNSGGVPAAAGQAVSDAAGLLRAIQAGAGRILLTDHVALGPTWTQLPSAVNLTWNLTIVGAAPSSRPAPLRSTAAPQQLAPDLQAFGGLTLLDFAFLSARLHLPEGVVLTFQNIELIRYQRALPATAFMFKSGPGSVVFDNCLWRAPVCTTNTELRLQQLRSFGAPGTETRVQYMAEPAVCLERNISKCYSGPFVYSSSFTAAAAHLATVRVPYLLILQETLIVCDNYLDPQCVLNQGLDVCSQQVAESAFRAWDEEMAAWDARASKRTPPHPGSLEPNTAGEDSASSGPPSAAIAVPVAVGSTALIAAAAVLLARRRRGKGSKGAAGAGNAGMEDPQCKQQEQGAASKPAAPAKGPQVSNPPTTSAGCSKQHLHQGFVPPHQLAAFPDSFDQPLASAERGMLRSVRANMAHPGANGGLASGAALGLIPRIYDFVERLVDRHSKQLGQSVVVLQQVLGRGATGVVYKGTWHGQTVAVKTLVVNEEQLRDASSSSADPLLREALFKLTTSRKHTRATNELAVNHLLRHKNTLEHKCYFLRPMEHAVEGEVVMAATGEEKLFKLYCVMECADRGDLAARVRDGAFLKSAEPPCTSSDRDPASAALGLGSSSALTSVCSPTPGGTVTVTGAGAGTCTPPGVQGVEVVVHSKGTEGKRDAGGGAAAAAAGAAPAPGTGAGTRGSSRGEPALAGDNRVPNLPHVLEVATDIAAGLSYIHSCKVVHGDLSPGNILLFTDSTRKCGMRAKIGDFGLSFLMSGTQQTHISGVVQGTMFFVAPEVASQGIVSPAADVFSLSVVLYLLLHGSLAWPEPHKLRRQTLASLDPAQLRWHPAVLEELRGLLLQCMSGDPSQRPQAAEMHTRLESLLESAA